MEGDKNKLSFILWLRKGGNRVEVEQIDGSVGGELLKMDEG